MSNVPFGGDNANSISSINANSLTDNLVSNVQGLLDMAPAAKHVSGPRAIIRINGKLAAFATSIQYRINAQQDEIFGIDDYFPQELAPKKITVEGTIGGLYLAHKGFVEMQIVPSALSFLFHKYLEIEIKDRVTDYLLFKTTKAVITGYSNNIQAEQMSSVSLTFRAIGWQDNITPSFPKNYDKTELESKSPL